MKHLFTYTQCELVRVVDGDTVVARVQLTPGPDPLYIEKHLRLARCDAPDQPLIQKVESAAALRERLAIEPTFNVRYESTDRYGRWVCEITTINGQNLTDFMIMSGHAVAKSWK